MFNLCNSAVRLTVGKTMFCTAGENPAIVVGNAQPDLIKWVDSQRINGGSESRLFLSTEKEAYGILDGIKNFGYEV